MSVTLIYAYFAPILAALLLLKKTQKCSSRVQCIYRHTFFVSFTLFFIIRWKTQGGIVFFNISLAIIIAVVAGKI